MNILIEITRDCNLSCAHCLRGEKEKKDIQMKDIIVLFKALKGQNISILTLTGGEPALKPFVIQMILDYAKFYEIDIYNFYIATNGTIASDEFLIALLKLWNYCSENEISSVDISNDTFHDIKLIQAEKLSALSFINYKFHSSKIDPFLEQKYNLRHTFQNPIFEYNYEDFDADSIISQGRGKDWGDKIPNQILFSDFKENPEDAEFYLNVNGDIILGCDWSYEEQENHKLCSVEHIGVYLERLKEYNQEYNQ